METVRLRQFCTVVETQNLRKAAELLKMSHGALSKSLKVLQDEIKLQLLMPSGRNIVVTDTGMLFYRKAREFLEHENQLLTPFSEKKNVLRLGTFEVFSTHFFCSLFKKYFEDLDLELHELIPGKLEQAINKQQVDYGLTYDPIPLEGVEYTKVGQISMGIFKAPGAFEGVKFENLPFAAPIAPIEGVPTGVRGLDGWPENKFKRLVKYRVDMMESGLTLVREKLAVIFLPTFLPKILDHKLVSIPLPSGMKTIHRDVFLLKRQSTPETGQYRLLAKMIRKECST